MDFFMCRFLAAKSTLNRIKTRTTMQTNSKSIPTKAENPEGLHQRYIIAKTEGKMDPNAEYFVLRLDYGSKDRHHIFACRKAIEAYAKEITHFRPQLAIDLMKRYGPPQPPQDETQDTTGTIKTQLLGKMSAMIYDLTQAKENLLRTKELKCYQGVMNAGERGSIEAMIDSLTYRIDLLKDLQKTV